MALDSKPTSTLSADAKLTCNLPERPKVNFVIAGAQKCGTTSLAAYLRQHPDIFVAEQEGHFFDRDQHFTSSEVDYGPYHQLFEASAGQACLGESTPVYLYWNSAAERIYRYNPAMKLLVLLRCPVARAYSAWNMEWQRGRDELPFAQAIQSEASRIKQALPQQLRIAAYVDRGFYARQLEHLWQHFPREQTLVLPSKQLRQASQSSLNKVCDFLSLPPLENFSVQQARSGNYETPLPKRLKENLQAVFHTENRRLEQLLSWDQVYWLD